MSTCAQGAEQLLSYLNGELAEPARAEFAAHLDQCAECREACSLWRSLGELPAPPPAPSEAMRRRLQMAIDASSPPSAAGGVRVRHGRPLWLAAVASAAAAVALVALGWFAARQAGAPETAALRDEVRHLRSLAAVSLLSQESASARLQGISYAGQVAGETGEVVKALVSALRFDSNVNVRLAACDALRRYAADASVRRAFADALAAEESPLVKLSLIDALAKFGERDSLRPLERVGATQGEDEIVRARAAKAVEQIRAQGLTWRQH